MFAGIIEAQSRVVEFKAPIHSSLAIIQIEKPVDFNDTATGDSIAVNGICLTVENITPAQDATLQFSLGRETLAVTGWSQETLLNKNVNLERSLKFGDRVHGHFVSGHVDAQGTVLSVSGEGSVNVDFEIPLALKTFVYKKGSIAINGVSLTVNQISSAAVVSVCLIPETLKRTNLGAARVGDKVNIEVDQFARAIVQIQKAQAEAQIANEAQL